MADGTPLMDAPPEPSAPGAQPSAPAPAGRRKRTGRAPGEPRNVAYLYLLPGVAV